MGASLALDRETALAQLRDDMTRDVVEDSRDAWEQYFASVPNFTCDDPYLERHYWYRWYSLRLMTVNIQAGRLPYPCVFEGAGRIAGAVGILHAMCAARRLLDAGTRPLPKAPS